MLSFPSLSVVQHRITALWFKDKELSLAFGLTVGCSRLGSVVNFLITQSFEERYGMQWTLWGGRSLTWPLLYFYSHPVQYNFVCCVGVLLCMFGFIIAIVVAILDHIGMKKMGLADVIKKGSNNMV